MMALDKRHGVLKHGYGRKDMRALERVLLDDVVLLPAEHIGLFQYFIGSADFPDVMEYSADAQRLQLAVGEA